MLFTRVDNAVHVSIVGGKREENNKRKPALHSFMTVHVPKYTVVWLKQRDSTCKVKRRPFNPLSGWVTTRRDGDCQL